LGTPLPLIAAAPGTGQDKGEYFYNFENAVFTPEGSNERWAVKGDMRAAEIPGPGGKAGRGTSIVTIRGTLGPVGRFGSLGACSRVIAVTKVVAVHSKRGKE
jgi:hypothetical protein